jgi:sortase A
MGLSILGLFLIFGPVVSYEVKYETKRSINNMLGKTEVNKSLPEKKILPPNMDFSIVIPKIEASAPVVANVDPYNEKEFQLALRKGVAHAKGTSYPGSDGNVYIFAHSTDAFYNVGRYNAVFYLIGKLGKGDEIDIYYKGQVYTYYVFDKKVVPPSSVEYLYDVKGEERLTLQTCYPPGTTINRLVVLARR